MLPSASIESINNALRRIKGTINDGDRRRFVFSKRPKNEDTMIKLGYKHDHILEEILQLTKRNYCKGPEQNLSRTGNPKGAVWVFGKVINDIEIYIKLQIIPQGELSTCVCISFHETTQKLYYPYA